MGNGSHRQPPCQLPSSYLMQYHLQDCCMQYHQQNTERQNSSFLPSIVTGQIELIMKAIFQVR